MSGRVRAPHDQSKLVKRRIGDVVDAQERIEGASLALVGELDIGNVIGDGTYGLGLGEHPLCRDIDELRFGVDEPADEPRARNTVDLGPMRPTCRFRERPPFNLREAGGLDIVLHEQCILTGPLTH
jgi:hypothetical protein